MESDLNAGDFRLLEVDNRLVIPVDTHIRLIVTGSDVIHSFAVPSLGIKIDSVPGKFNWPVNTTICKKCSNYLFINRLHTSI